VRKADRDSRRRRYWGPCRPRNGIAVATGDVSGLRDALAGLLGNEQLRRRMGEAGRLAIERHYSWSAIAAKFEQLYRATHAPVRGGYLACGPTRHGFVRQRHNGNRDRT